MIGARTKGGNSDGQTRRQGRDRDRRGPRSGAGVRARLAGLGAKIAVADINLKSFEEYEAEAKTMTADSTVAEIEAGGGEAIGIEMDVTDEAAVNAMVAEVMKKWGRVDILVANAGGGRGRPVDTKASALDSSLSRLVVSMNLFGTVYSVNAVAPVMKQQRSGKIVYTRYLAQDLGQFGITANCIAPGTITTGRVVATVMPHRANANRDRTEQVALRRLGSVEDCAKVVEFLCTDLSDYVTGQCIAIDGGLMRGN